MELMNSIPFLAHLCYNHMLEYEFKDIRNE